MAWTSEGSDEYDAWFKTLSDDDQESIVAAVEVLEERGPNLGRPLVDTIVASNYKNMKELRPGSSGTSEVRILFAFDPTRKALMLMGGNKTGRWKQWYDEAIPVADEIYRKHLETLKKAAKGGTTANSKNDHKLKRRRKR